MKHFRLYLTALVTSVMAACSSMEVDENELYAENFPKDFVDSVYLELTPSLRGRQVARYIADYNSSLQENMESGKYKAMFTEDTTAFWADTAALHEIFVAPIYLGLSEELWEDMWQTTVTKKETCKNEVSIKELFLIIKGDNKFDTSKVVVDSIQYKGTNMGTVYGKRATDSTTQAFVLDGDSIKFYNKDVVRDTVKVCDTLSVEKPGAIASSYKNYLLEFNFIDTQDDLVALKKVPLDMKAIAYHYVTFGKMHGFPYRYCKAGEKNNPVRPVLGVTDTVDKLYCSDDNGVVREIK